MRRQRLPAGLARWRAPPLQRKQWPTVMLISFDVIVMCVLGFERKRKQVPVVSKSRDARPPTHHHPLKRADVDVNDAPQKRSCRVAADLHTHSCISPIELMALFPFPPGWSWKEATLPLGGGKRRRRRRKKKKKHNANRNPAHKIPIMRE